MMLRRCVQRASSLPFRSSARCLPVAAGQTHQLNNCRQRRSYGLSRHPDPLAPNVDLNTVENDDSDADVKKKVYTADDLEYQEVNKDWSNEDDTPLDDIFEEDSSLQFFKTKRQPTQAEIEYREKQARIQEELNSRTGRLWEERWVITDEEWMSTDTYDDIEEWSIKMATRKALESVKVWEAGVPTLQEMANLDLPPTLPAHPGHGAPLIHAKARKNHLSKRLRTTIQVSIADDLENILTLTSWQEKQEAVDRLFEVIEDRVREKEPVLAKLPDFKERVEDGLEQVLRMVQSRVKGAKKGSTIGESNEDSDDSKPSVLAKEELDNVIDVMGVKNEQTVPVFMDLLKAANGQKHATLDDNTDENPSPKKGLSNFFTKPNESGVPNLVYPLNVHHNEGSGRMVEEWELAANKETKRIMMRDGMKKIAAKIVEAANCCGGNVEEDKKGSARVFITGKRGVGKTAALAGLVASARVSGHIVAYLPDGDRLRKHGFYIEPCSYRSGLYNLPEIAKEFCEQLLASHGEDIKDLTLAKENMTKYLSEDQVNRLFLRASVEGEGSSATELSLDKILDVGTGSASLASGCYSMVISSLMNQTKKPFTVVMDEFNCYYDHGHYFHMDYDENVRKAIPINKITIFKPFLDAMGLYPAVVGNGIAPDETTPTYAPMKWGSMIVAVSESRAVRQTFTQALTESARVQSQKDSSFHVVDLQRFYDTEVQHVLYNFECTGIGRLRFDRGYTTLNPDEVEYLRMVSGGLGQPLLDSCMLP